MKFYAVLIVCALMVAASVDAVPDPPAVTPHSVSVKDTCPLDFVGDFRVQRVTARSACISPQVPIHRVTLADGANPKRSSDPIILTGYAADPSPPVL